MKEKRVKLKNWIVVLLLVIIIGIIFIVNQVSKTELRSISSMEQLENIYKGGSDDYSESLLFKLATMPYSYNYNYNKSYNIYESSSSSSIVSSGDSIDSITSASSSSSSNIASTQKDYSTTNIQVENVDEADIVKTDGDYIYSISEDNVIITDVRDPENIEIASKITPTNSGIPVDILLYNNKLVVISEKTTSSGSYSYYNSKNTTIVEIYNINDKEEPIKITDYEVYQPYYTSRCIDNKLYIISLGNLRRDNNNKIITYYEEDNDKKEIGLENIKYLTDLKTKKQTIIAYTDLDNLEKQVEVTSYLIDVENAYISNNSIYLLEEEYSNSENENKIEKISKLFGIKGILAITDMENYYSEKYTKIYKFDILDNGKIEYKCKNKVKGQTINQYSIDEYNNNLRVALYNDDGSRIVIFDEGLNKIGETASLAEGEKMYSSRFIGDRAYLVTYKTIDPLFVIDLSDAQNPTVLGELKIPGYSTYLHPYDENHIIGIGMETSEQIYKDSTGRLISTTATITGMKMALFDVTDVSKPKQISSTVIGDKRTTSAILTNPKALLFSKEKELIAIPINNYAEDFEINSSESIESIEYSYINNSKNYISEGYAVYNINLTDGIKLKGIINHEYATAGKYKYSYTSKLLRGLYIEDNLYTVSEETIKINKIDDLELVNELKIKGE